MADMPYYSVEVFPNGLMIDGKSKNCHEGKQELSVPCQSKHGQVQCYWRGNGWNFLTKNKVGAFQFDWSTQFDFKLKFCRTETVIKQWNVHECARPLYFKLHPPPKGFFGGCIVFEWSQISQRYSMNDPTPAEPRLKQSMKLWFTSLSLILINEHFENLTNPLHFPTS
jgi:hypothetical protein